jgi:hypothetical protein
VVSTASGLSPPAGPCLGRHTHTHTHTSTNTNTRIDSFTHMHTNSHTHTYTHTHTHTNTQTHAHTHTYTHIHTRTHRNSRSSLAHPPSHLSPASPLLLLSFHRLLFCLAPPLPPCQPCNLLSPHLSHRLPSVKCRCRFPLCHLPFPRPHTQVHTRAPAYHREGVGGRSVGSWWSAPTQSRWQSWLAQIMRNFEMVMVRGGRPAAFLWIRTMMVMVL